MQILSVSSKEVQVNVDCETFSFQISFIFLFVTFASCWENIPEIPTNRRSQYYLRHDDGAYKYGYDSGDGIAATQTSSANNQVEGFYLAPNFKGQLVQVRYTAGVQGFVPETSEAQTTQSQAYRDQTHQAWNSQKQHQASHAAPNFQMSSASRFSQSDLNENSDASYQLSFNTGEHAREENSDAAGNVKGKYSYVDEAGEHDLSYIAGPEIGFKVTGGSLAPGNGQSNSAIRTSFGQVASNKLNSHSQTWKSPAVPNVQQAWKSSEVSTVQPSSDGSYSFSYNTGDHSRSESSDRTGKVQGRYSYTDEAGQHDLSYVAGGEAGFVVTGGSLSEANAGKSLNSQIQHQTGWSQSPIRAGAVQSFKGLNDAVANQDGSAYSFSYNTDSQSRQESGDASGHVKGSYNVQTDGGQQQLSFIAGGQGSSYDLSVDYGGRSEPFEVQGTGRLRPHNTHKSLHPSYSVLTPSTDQKSFEYGPKNALILTFLPPKHPEKYGYIYDTQK